MNENQEAEKLAKWLKINRYVFTHIGNESGLPPRVAMLAAVRKKRMGLSPGVPDFMICLKRGSLLFIELKKERKRKKNGEFYALSTDGIHISPEQEKWIQELNKIDNVGAEICFGANESIQLIQEYE